MAKSFDNSRNSVESWAASFGRNLDVADRLTSFSNRFHAGLRCLTNCRLFMVSQKSKAFGRPACGA